MSRVVVKFDLRVLGAGGGDTYSRPTVNLSIYTKYNGTVSESDYSSFRTQSFNSGYAGTQYTLDDVTINNFDSPADYVEIMFKYSTDGIPIPSNSIIKTKVSEFNPLIGRFMIFDNITK